MAVGKGKFEPPPKGKPLQEGYGKPHRMLFAQITHYPYVQFSVFLTTALQHVMFHSLSPNT